MYVPLQFSMNNQWYFTRFRFSKNKLFVEGEEPISSSINIYLCIKNNSFFKMASTEAELDNLYPSWKTRLNWISFGNFTQGDLDGLKVQWFQDDFVNRGLLQDIWTRHHDRNQGKKSSTSYY